LSANCNTKEARSM